MLGGILLFQLPLAHGCDVSATAVRTVPLLPIISLPLSSRRRSRILITRASLREKEKPDLTLYDLQKALRSGYGEAMALFDWLADTHVATGNISNHWIRCGRAYVLNNPCPNLVEMGTMLAIGERRAFLVMLALEQKGVIRIKEEFSFERRIRMSSCDNLVRQMKRSPRSTAAGASRSCCCAPSTSIWSRQCGSPSMVKSTWACAGNAAPRS